MELILATIIFLATIFLIIVGIIDRSVIAIFGAIVMILTGILSETEAFFAVDWNIIALLIGIWIIATYFNKSGIPKLLAVKIFSLSKRRTALLISLLGLLAGFLSVFLDNVIVVLMMASIIVPMLKPMKVRVTPFILFSALCANFMGTALLLGDLPPQMLHSVTGIEFLEFIWQFNKPSSFPILTASFILTILAFYYLRFKREFKVQQNENLPDFSTLLSDEGALIEDRRLATIVTFFFIATIVTMSFRQFLGVKLGLIAFAGAVLLVATVEILGKWIQKPSFEEILTALDWKAVIFYIALFILVGGINKAGLIKLIAELLTPLLSNPLIGSTALYWFTVPIVGIVEHDAYILTFLHVIKDLSSIVDPWPYWWLLLWAGTIGSNLTMVGAPALYIALNLCEKEDGRVSLKEFFSMTIPFVLISSSINYLLAMFIWIMPPV